MGEGARVCEALRFLGRAGIVDWNGHASTRVAGGFLINTAASNRAVPVEAELCTVSVEGELVEGDRPPNEAHLHAAIYRARPEVQAVVHGHPRHVCALTAAGMGLAPLAPQAATLGALPVYPHSHSISSRERGEAVATAMGRARGAVLRSHGLVVAGPDLVTACVLALYAEQAAERQVLAAPLGGAQALPPEEIAEHARTLASPALLRKCWDFILSGGD